MLQIAWNGFKSSVDFQTSIKMRHEYIALEMKNWFETDQKKRWTNAQAVVLLTV